jgi:hypothetical protein
MRRAVPRVDHHRRHRRRWQWRSVTKFFEVRVICRCCRAGDLVDVRESHKRLPKVIQGTY